MKKNLSFLPALSLVALFLSSCMKPVAIRENYDFGRIKRVGVISFKDYPSHPNSGETVGDTFVKHLLRAGYNVIERTDLEKVLTEQKLNISGIIDQATAKKIGNISGIDAVITGTVSLFSPAKKDVVLVKVKEVTTEGRREKQSEGKEKIEKPERVITKTVEKEEPHIYTIEAEVGITAKMIDVETGEIIWASSYSYEAVNSQIAIETVVAEILGELRHTWPKK